MARGEVASVELCGGCRVVSIHFGATTVRMDPAACASLWTTLGQALAEMGALGIVKGFPGSEDELLEPARFHS